MHICINLTTNWSVLVRLKRENFFSLVIIYYFRDKIHNLQYYRIYDILIYDLQYDLQYVIYRIAL